MNEQDRAMNQGMRPDGTYSPTGQTPTQQGSGGGQDIATKAQEGAQQATEKAKEVASQYADKAQEQLETGKEQAAGGMQRAAETIREKTPESGVAAQAGTKVAEGMEQTAQYLQEHSTDEILGDLETYVRSHPTQAVVGAIFVGFMLGRILR